VRHKNLEIQGISSYGLGAHSDGVTIVKMITSNYRHVPVSEMNEKVGKSQQERSHSVLFVCIGNICRSAMAEIILNCLVQEKPYNEIHWTIDSAATGYYHIGESPDPRAIATCKKHLSNCTTTHRTRQIQSEDFNRFEYIFCMDNNDITSIQRFQPKTFTATIKLLGELDPKGQKVIQDPFYGGDEGFETSYTQITRCCKTFLDYIIKKDGIKL